MAMDMAHRTHRVPEVRRIEGPAREGRRVNTRSVVASAGFYPITQMYVVAVAVSVALINMWITLTGAIVILGVAAVAAVMAVMLRELKTVHRVMNGQRVELLDRIDLLTEALLNHDVRVPTESAGTKQIRVDAAEVES